MTHKKQVQLQLITYLTKNILDFEVQSGIMKNDISDNFGIFLCLEDKLERKTIYQYIIQKNITESSVEKFKELMSAVD